MHHDLLWEIQRGLVRALSFRATSHVPWWLAALALCAILIFLTRPRP